MRAFTSAARPTTLVLTAALLTACASSPVDNNAVAAAQLVGTDGEKVGTAYLSKTPKGLDLTITVAGLAPGDKALHLHAIGDCSSPDFKSAGGHLNPANKAHGKQNPLGSHLGDLPNIPISADGTGGITAPIFGDSDVILHHIFDEDGTAVMLHAGPDDYVSDPAGAAGPRIACGVLAAS